MIENEALAEANYKMTSYTPDLAICDLGLPDKKGLDVCYLLELRAFKLGRERLPIVVPSGWDKKQSESMGQRHWKPVACLQKPMGKD